MPTDHHDDQTRRAFHGTYQRMIEALPATELDWPLAHTLQQPPPRRSTAKWGVAGAVVLVAAAFAVGWLAAPDRRVEVAYEFQPVTASTALAVPDTDSIAYASPNEAVIAAALEQEPDLVDPTFQMIVIYADESIVDLRVKLQADGFCHWYGATGRVNDDKLDWRAGPADACDP